MTKAHVSYQDAPRNLSSLNQRLRIVAGDDADADAGRLLRVMAHVVVAQLIPGGVVKGGTALNLRGGEDRTRFTTDLDTARPPEMSVEDYIAAFTENLKAGWNGFEATIIERKGPQPKDVPDDYIMRPYDVKLKYLGRSVCTVTVELGHDEIGSTMFPVAVMAASVSDVFVRVGFPAPELVPVLASEYQIVQKLHACTFANVRVNAEGGESRWNERAHDLVDIQLLAALEPPDLIRLNEAGQRIFASRRSTFWPPTVTIWDGWPDRYDAAAQGLDLRTLDDAVDWVNALVNDAVAAAAAHYDASRFRLE